MTGVIELLEAARAIERFSQAVESRHTCELSHLRYPWPLDRNCSGCRRDLDSYVRRFHWQLPLALFGWDVIIEQVIRELARRREQAETYRQIGAGI